MTTEQIFFHAEQSTGSIGPEIAELLRYSAIVDICFQEATRSWAIRVGFAPDILVCICIFRFADVMMPFLPQ